jgi:uncharacterized protein YjiK
VVDERFFLVASRGRIYECAEGEDGEGVIYNTYGTGIGSGCDVEGLAYEPADRTLLLICKETGTRDGESYIVVYKWSIDRRLLLEDEVLLFPLKGFTDRIRGKSFSPSGIERHPLTGHYIILAAQEEAIAEVTPAGVVLGVRELPGEYHRQAEGIAMTPDLDLFIADEGGSGRARLSRYRPGSGLRQEPGR